MRAWLRDLPDRHYAAFWTLMLALLLAMALVTIEAASYPPVRFPSNLHGMKNLIMKNNPA